MAAMTFRFKAVRTDRELECPEIDAGLRAAGCEIVLLPEGVSEDELVAAGKIGRSMARMAAGFRMRIIGYDPYVSADVMRTGGIEKIEDLRALLRRSDIVSIHAVLNDETRHLIGGLELGLMKPSAFLI